MPDAQRQQRLRELPSVDELLRSPALCAQPHRLALIAARRAVESARERVLAGGDGFREEDLSRALGQLQTPNLRRVLNATGVVLHTNLGRAPLAARAVERLREAAGYCNLELELEEGERGSRYQPVVELLCSLTGAEDAMVVNNCAAAVLLALGALGRGREGVVSRGELVEIGGGFRVPEVMAQSGMKLIEVGTTNRTRLADYQAAVTPQTALLLKVHRSNFAVVGFTEEVHVRELVTLGLPVVVDLGSGALEPLHAEGLTQEPTVASVVAAGPDLVLFSGDKLLGGPQAGLMVGKRTAIAACRAHPLNRALRIDKLTVAALEATLELYRDGMSENVPARGMLLQTGEQLRARAEGLKLRLMSHAVQSSVVETVGQVGGGSMPLAEPKSWACAISRADAEALHRRLRAGSPPVVGRVSEGQLLLDVRCLTDDDLEPVALSVRNAC
ncbi:MAG: L-seryl-tRNA(Sec) selenium transferase [Archangiaceae bacterium]|nr:L-seryl-tRNA(Sec) selenium transferase [Archangiaceae bacterium]